MRFHVGFPAFGRTINAGELDKILFDFLPDCVEKSLYYRTCDKKRLLICCFLNDSKRLMQHFR